MFKIFTTEACRFCKLAKSALDARGYDYEEVAVTEEIKAQLVAIGLKTVPQIYHQREGVLAPTHVGGYEDLVRYLGELEDAE
ncbi:MAG: glutaredoxin domain-containing protein [Gemmobacter sp.]